MVLLDGKKLAQDIKAELKAEVAAWLAAGKEAPHLAAVLVGDDPASQVYVRNKVQSFIVQLPLPRHINEERITLAIAPEKDVDGFHPVNFGRMAQGLPCYLPATPYGIMEMIRRYELPTRGKEVVVVGRSNIVGTPMVILLSRKGYPGDGTVTLCHSRTADLAFHTRRADILIAAIGIPEMITGDMIKEGAVVIDVGINRINDPSREKGFRLAGDVHFESAAQKAAFITPVPGGVGQMTVVSLLMNTLKAAKGEIYPKA